MEPSRPSIPTPLNGHIHNDAQHGFSSSVSSNVSESSQATPITRKNKLEKLARKTRQATKLLFVSRHQQHEHQDLTRQSDPATRVLQQDPAFNPAKLDCNHQNKHGLTAKVQTNLQTVAAAILHPKEEAKGKATRSTAGRLSRIERPYISKDMDIELLEAHDSLSRPQSAASSDQIRPEQRPESLDAGLKEKVEELEAQRESLRVAHTLKRHVQRVRVVPKRHIDFPKDEDFVEQNDDGRHVGYDWLKWIGHVGIPSWLDAVKDAEVCQYMLFHTQDFTGQYIDDFDELPFDIDSLRLQVERLTISSAPWQAFFMDMRSIYRWEDPTNTAKWLAVYISLWYTQHLLGFVYGYVIYMVVKNRYFPSSVGALRASMHRAHDQRGQAYKLGELVDKHGRSHWLEPLLDDLGPFVQLQVNDMANMLEVFANFYAWIYPRKTAATLIFFTVCFLVTVLTDMAYCMKITTFIGGGAFFFCWPIASRWAKYRLLTSPLKWVFWGIPTDAERAFQYLRKHGQLARERLVEQAAGRVYQSEQNSAREPSHHAVPDNATESDKDEDWHSVHPTPSALDADFVSYRAFSRGVGGRLVVYSGGIRFVRSRGQEIWRHSFLELVEMRKKENSAASKIPMISSQGLEVTFINSGIVVLERMRERDAAFSNILGLSGLQWQSLQAKTVNGDSYLSL
ncbi:MAG: hypothetical protein L6R36_003363 [Xanthoria steineri]|nr:MAG: hypothetical protein L6R36_003363 [Xanthoria steineri]